MASQVQIPFEGVILQEHSAPISCPTPNFAKGSPEKGLVFCPPEAFAKYGSGIFAGNGHKRHKNTKRAER